jgi:YVTN family beta-propeller protein
MRKNLFAALVCLGILGGMALTARPRDVNTPSRARLRQPVALVATDGGNRLFVANHRSGSVSEIDVAKKAVAAEADVGRSLADLAAAPDGRLFAVDEAAGELVVLTPRRGGPAVTHRVAVSSSPVSVCMAAGPRAVVACLWQRLLAVVAVPASGAPRLERTIELPFAPRLQLALPGGERVLVADAFGGRLALVDVRQGRIESVRDLVGHNIRGMGLSTDGKEVLLAHQILAEQTPARADEVRWGNVISNVVRVLVVEDVLQPKADLLRRSRLHTLGTFLRGAADPAGLAVAGGKVVVTLGGTGEVAVGPASGPDWARLAAGRRPTAVTTDAAGRRAFVADTFGDRISVVDLKDQKKVAEISLGPTPPLAAAERGEMLFFDGHLSKEGWMSCHSCHSDGHTSGLRSDTLGDGSYGAPKRAPTLRGVGDTGPWAWNGSMADLKTQLRQSVHTTMHGRATEEQIADLEAYLRTLSPPPPLLGQGTQTAAVRHGKEVFEAQACGRCHVPPTYTSPRTYEVGLSDELGKDHFNPPSLRGVAQGTAFFHDGRAATLDEVFTRFRHQVSKDLVRKDLDDLVSFLRTL